MSSNSRELLYKWLLFIFLGACTPLPFYAPVVGTYPTSYFIILVQGAWLVVDINPFSLLVLAEIVFYTTLMYVAAKYLARYFNTSKNRPGKLILALLLMVDVLLAAILPLSGTGDSISIFNQYLQFL